MSGNLTRVSIAEAALRLGLSYHQTQRLVLIGRLAGGRGEKGWFVDADSLEREVRERVRTTTRGENVPAA